MKSTMTSSGFEDERSIQPPERKTIRLKKQNLFGSGYAGLGSDDMVSGTLKPTKERYLVGEPVELTPRRGDVLFYHYLCAHAGSKNTSAVPRLALNMKW